MAIDRIAYDACLGSYNSRMGGGCVPASDRTQRSG
jgi:hypothetical protein